MTATVHNLTTYRLKKQQALSDKSYNHIDFGTFTQDLTGVEKAQIKLAIVDDKLRIFFESFLEERK